MDVQVRGEGRRLSPAVEIALYRVTQEAVTNILKHATASYVEIDLDLSRDECVALRIEDDGRGFSVSSEGASAAGGGVGLFGMYERISLVGGQLTIDSAPGEGTELRVTVPLVGRLQDEQLLAAA